MGRLVSAYIDQVGSTFMDSIVRAEGIMLRAAGGQERTIFAALFSCRFESRAKGFYGGKLMTRLGLD